MDAALRRPMALDDFLAWGRRQELRHGFDGIQAVAATGGTVGHGVVAFASGGPAPEEGWADGGTPATFPLPRRLCTWNRP